MILREVSAPFGQPACWAFISQIEHARLAHDLARQWDSLPFDRRVLHDILLPVVAHHDDGWTDWDSAPRADPASGRPYSFLDMPLPAALEIWSLSVAAVERFGPLAPWLVAQHFIHLLAPSDNVSEPIAKSWLADQAANCAQWLAAWLAVAEREHLLSASVATETANDALAALQFFDRLSLWFCCREQPEPLRVAAPTGIQVGFRLAAPGQVLVSNWPFQSDGFSINVAALRVAARAYRSTADLAIAPHEAADFAWELVPW